MPSAEQDWGDIRAVSRTFPAMLEDSTPKRWVPFQSDKGRLATYLAAASSSGSVTLLEVTAGRWNVQGVGAPDQQNGLDTRSLLYAAESTSTAATVDRVTGGAIPNSTLTSNTQFGLDVRAFLFARRGTDTFTPLEATVGGALFTRGDSVAGITTAADQTVTTTAGSILASTTGLGERTIIVQNIGTTNNARVGDANITAARGIQLVPGASTTLKTKAAIYGIAEASTTDLAVTVLD